MSPASGEATEEVVRRVLNERRAGASLAPFLGLLEEALGAGRAFRTLVQLELRLALRDGARAVAIALLLLPVLVLLWLSVSALAGWVTFSLSQSVAAALLTVAALQLLVLVVMSLLLRRYSKSLRLPYTRQYIGSLTGRSGHGTDGTQR